MRDLKGRGCAVQTETCNAAPGHELLCIVTFEVLSTGLVSGNWTQRTRDPSAWCMPDVMHKWEESVYAPIICNALFTCTHMRTACRKQSTNYLAYKPTHRSYPEPILWLRRQFWRHDGDEQPQWKWCPWADFEGRRRINRIKAVMWKNSLLQLWHEVAEFNCWYMLDACPRQIAIDWPTAGNTSIYPFIALCLLQDYTWIRAERQGPPHFLNTPPEQCTLH